MNRHIQRSLLPIYGLPLLIMLFSVGLTLSPLLSQQPALAMGITYDLTLTAPLLYLFLMRTRRIPKITAVPVFVLGVVLASLLLPEHQKYHLGLITTYILPLVEVTMLAVIGYHAYNTAKAFRASTHGSQDFYMVIKEATIRTIGYPQIAKVFASEIAMVYYALWNWKKESANGFTSYKENGVTALLGTVVFIAIIELFVAHLLLVRWNEMVAWVLTAGSFYATFQLLGHIKAIRRRYSEITGSQLFLKYGLFGDMVVDLKDVLRAEITPNTVEVEDKKVEKLALLKDVESHNVAIYFREKQTIEKAYGISTRCDIVLLHIDDKQAFVEKLNQALHRSNSN
ncbi:hypothetical protein [Telluribacter sp. SYSU D00476]|uniref:hypothetical protein n=1 Tax=Telluribacter sp. SYSU D00476 TaxID=2811430 RepID=UPI001FF1A726|nr:hypothetical protein [Telluribacter sp. SYSU D00476]